MAVIGRITSVDGHVDQLTQEDALWMGRAVVGESVADAAELVETVLRRWAYVRDRRSGRYPRVTDMLRAYSSPVNPSPRGGMNSRRERIQSMPWATIPGRVRNTVERYYTGRARFRTTGLVHWGAPSEAEALRSRSPEFQITHRGENHFLSSEETRSYGNPRVIGVRRSADSDGSGSGDSEASFHISTIVVPALLVAGAVYYWRSKR